MVGALDLSAEPDHVTLKELLGAPRRSNVTVQ
jgi:hypothetical protein